MQGHDGEHAVESRFPHQGGETVLVHAAAGATGHLVAQWAKHLGATVIGTVSTEEKATFARAHGCDHVINYTRDDFVKGVREITGGKGVPVVLDSVGRDTFMKSLDCLQFRGTCLLYGLSSGQVELFDPTELSIKGCLYLSRPSTHQYHPTPEIFRRSAIEVFDVLKSGAVKLHIGQRYRAERTSARRILRSRSAGPSARRSSFPDVRAAARSGRSHCLASTSACACAASASGRTRRHARMKLAGRNKAHGVRELVAARAGDAGNGRRLEDDARGIDRDVLAEKLTDDEIAAAGRETAEAGMKTRLPTVSATMSTPSPPVSASTSAEKSCPSAATTTWSAPAAASASRFAALRVTAMTVAPAALATSMAASPTPPLAPVTSTIRRA